VATQETTKAGAGVDTEVADVVISAVGIAVDPTRLASAEVSMNLKTPPNRDSQCDP
jgi:hypothetical protein